MAAGGRSAGGKGDRFVRGTFEPAYLALHRSGELWRRAESALEELGSCNSCPRGCGVNRARGEICVCNTGRLARVSSAFPHHGEEDCLRGWRGSGTIFFGCCNLRCVFCQNADISHGIAGREQTGEQIAALMLKLQAAGCHNINFVTPEHVVPQVIEAIALAVPAGLRLPIVYNTSAYDCLPSLELLDGLIDIYMPDFKFWDADSAKRYCKAKDYPEVARRAILEMHRQVGDLTFDADGLALRGLLIRHLVMPGLGHESAAIFRFLAEEVSPDTFVNIMPQYRPAHEVGRRARRGGVRYATIDRAPTIEEIRGAHRAASLAGLWRFDERREHIQLVF